MSRPFIHGDFLLQTETARRLFHEVAEPLPIIDYHCHLAARDIAAGRRFENLFEIWLEGDHYKWRAMRANGIAERFCTGDAEPFEKFSAWCATVPHTLRNPLHHWTHLELKRFFGIDCPVSPSTAREIWDEANRQLAQPGFNTTGILKKFRIEVACTTDDPADALSDHASIAANPGIFTRVFPTFRPDRAMDLSDPSAFGTWCEKLAAAAGTPTGSFKGFLEALGRRHDFFHGAGCRLSDHGLQKCPALFADGSEAASIFERVRSGGAATPAEQEAFGGNLLLFFGRLDAEKNWTKQLHLGALRNTNTRAFRTLGPDTGFDTIGDWRQIEPLARFLDRLDSDNALPRTILYNLNPADNHSIATLAGCFQDGTVPGKIQFGSAWWFLDQKQGIESQLDALSACGLLSRFVGMLTDSRSFMSFPRHEYFRRILCNLIGNDIEAGLLPGGPEPANGMVRRLCFENAAAFFSFPARQTGGGASD
jgi:glucuronate isomerase